MRTGPSRSGSTRSPSGEEYTRPPALDNEQTPLLPTQHPKPHHRLLSVQVPLWLPRRHTAVFISFIGATMTMLLLSGIFIDPVWKERQSVFMNNGTHDFRKTVVLVSFDGFRADYLERGLTPNLLATANGGLRARWMQPSYPTASFPNHWSIMTGLFPESHGIIANEFIQPETGAHFVYREPNKSWDPSWWGGEPVWETAIKAGLKVADLMWPGPPVTRNGNKPTYSIRFRRQNITLQDKADQIFSWIDLPSEKRPQFITMYEPLFNDVGHRYGPDLPQTDDALTDIDVFAHAIRVGLNSRNLTSIVNVVYLSDHGMAPTHNREWIYLDDILGEGANEIEWSFSRPSAGLWFRSRANVTRHLEALHRASSQPPHNFKVYTATSKAWPNVYNGIEIPLALQNPFPAHKHFSPDHNSRIPPVYVIPETGCFITRNRETDPISKLVKGDHGYDNEDPFMRSLFIASGPFANHARDRVFTQAQAQSSSTSPTPNQFSQPSRTIHTPQTHNTTVKSKASIYAHPGSGGRNDPVLLDEFQNVEVYGLLMRLLGIKQHSAKTNSTDGFWDEWFDRF